MKSEIKEGVLVVFVQGDLLGETYNEPVMSLLKSSFEAGNKKILFNLSEMKFINSTGLGMLLSAASKTKSAGGVMALCNLPEQMTKLLKMSKLESIFQIHSDETTAIAFWKAI